MEPKQTPAEAAQAAPLHHVPIEFTGSGAEYFRIWIVNLLLLLLTLGLYWPWAKVRRLRYFWGNTLVDGDPLDFHGDARQMFKGWLLMMALFGVYNWAGNFSELAGLIAFVALGLLWPALWRSSMVFRLANTSWRGLRLRFAGNTAGAYAALLPILLAVLPLMVLGLWVSDDSSVPTPEWVMIAAAVCMALGLALSPWLLWRMKAYQHRHYALGQLQTDFRAPLRGFYMLVAKQAGLFLLLPVVAGGVVWALSENLAALVALSKQFSIVHWFTTVLILLMVMAVFVGLGPWWTTRLQNLVWTKTGNSRLRFISKLRFRDMFWLGLRNHFLIAITLGLYWPFAAISMARLRLEAVQIRSVVDLQTLLSAAHEGPGEAAGEAAGDFFGLDVGM